jgi:hypothetical protein
VKLSRAAVASEIGRSCGVADTTVRNYLDKLLPIEVTQSRFSYLSNWVSSNLYLEY